LPAGNVVNNVRHAMPPPPACAPFGAYVHVPFCRHRCDYCAFATWTDRGHLVDRYLAACRRQVDVEVAAGIPPITSVFFGGGTPSHVPPGPLLDVLAGLPLAAQAEVTVECNPDDVSPLLLHQYAAGGVTRLSFGVQSMSPKVLRALGRRHNPTNVRRAAENAHRIGLPFSVDLIYGAIGETLEDWSATLDAALALEPVHVSAYALTVEPGTPLGRDSSRHPDDDHQAGEYRLAAARLEAAGFGWYELSNWALPGHECRHNLLYWAGGEYLAIGCAAHGHRDGVRHWNVRTPERYIEAIEALRLPVRGSEELDADDARVEALQLALRTRDGVPAEAFDAHDLATLDRLVEPVNGDSDTPRVRLTVDGRLLANEVAVRVR
jgi:oxygen-independent coproporphyrinogen-3 oxidase